MSPWRDEIWEFYRKEEEEPEFLTSYRQYHARQTMKMTHMETFFYPVWEMENCGPGVRMEAPEFVLFDYGERDALTGNAKIWRVRCFI